MMPAFHSRSAFASMLIFALSVSLIVSFGLHSVQIEHTHHVGHGAHYAGAHEEGGDVVMISEYFHGIAQKFFAILIAVFSLGLIWSISRNTRARFCKKMTRLVPKLSFTGQSITHRNYSYIHELLRVGVLHSKVH